MNTVLGISNTTVAIVVSILAVPLVLGRVKMNRIYGARFAKAFKSEENWYAINKKGGKLMLIWSLPVLLSGIACFLWPLQEAYQQTLIAFVPILYVVAALQTYAYAQRL